jgi:hypothetical protein
MIVSISIAAGATAAIGAFWYWREYCIELIGDITTLQD